MLEFVYNIKLYDISFLNNVPFLVWDISYIFISKNTIVSLYFFKGLVYGLDFNWDTTELMLAHYNNSMYLECSILLSCVSTTGVIGFILLASSLNLMDKQTDDISRKISYSKSDSSKKIPMNLCCSEDKTYGVWNFFSFVYDERDPSGTHLPRLLNRWHSTQQVRYIDGLAYTGFLYRPSVAIGQGAFAHFNFPGTKVEINPRVLRELEQTHIIYSGMLGSNNDLPRVGDTLFLKQFFDRVYREREDSYGSDSE